MQATKELLEGFVNNIEKMGYERGFKDGNMNNKAFAESIEEAYRNGINDAWEAMAVILRVSRYDLKAMGLPVSGVGYDIAEIVARYSGMEAVNKVRVWKERERIIRAWREHRKIEIGDEVAEDGGLTYIITRIYQGCYDAICPDGAVYHDLDIADKHKTGRHFDIEEILGRLRGEE